MCPCWVEGVSPCLAVGQVPRAAHHWAPAHPFPLSLHLFCFPPLLPLPFLSFVFSLLFQVLCFLLFIFLLQKSWNMLFWGGGGDSFAKQREAFVFYKTLWRVNSCRLSHHLIDPLKLSSSLAWWIACTVHTQVLFCTPSENRRFSVNFPGFWVWWLRALLFLI